MREGSKAALYTRLRRERIGRWADDVTGYLVRHPAHDYSQVRLWAHRTWDRELRGADGPLLSRRRAEADLIIARAFLQAPAEPTDPRPAPARWWRHVVLTLGAVALGLYADWSARRAMAAEYRACATLVASGNTERAQRSCAPWLAGGMIP